MVYGAGVFGKQLVGVLGSSLKYEVVGWVDKGFAEYRNGGWML